MNCSEVKKTIQLYLDNELDARNTLEAQSHLESCFACSALLEAYSKQDHLLREFARAETANHQKVREDILAAIRNQPLRAQRPLFAPRLLRRVAAVAAIAALATLLLLRGGSLPGLDDKVYAAAVADHFDHCTLDKLTMATTNSGEIDKMVAEYGHLKKSPDLSTYGYSGLRAKVCPVTGGKILHLVFQSSEQPPLSVFMRPHRDNDQIDSHVHVKQESSCRVAGVSVSGVDVLVVTSLDDNQTAMILQTVVGQL